MFRVEIPSAEVRSRPWEMNGRSGTSRTQVGYAHVGKPYPVEIKIKLGDRPAFEPGQYVTGPDCFQVQQDGSLIVRFTDLHVAPRVAAARQA